MRHEQDVTILGGLPVTVSFTIQRAEPDVGIMSDYPEDVYVERVKEKKIGDKFAQSLGKRIDDMKGEYDRLCETLMENL